MDRLQSDGTLTAAYLTTLDLIAQRAVMGINWNPGLGVTYSLEGIERNPFLTARRKITAYIVRDSVASMRTRQQSRGADPAPF